MGGGARNHGGTRGHGCLPLPGERANYNLHTLSDKKLFKIINCSEKVKEKEPSNQKLMLVKVLPQVKTGVSLEKVPQKVLEGQYQKTEHKYKKKSSTRISTNVLRSHHKVDKKKPGVTTPQSVVPAGGSVEAINDVTKDQADPVRKVKNAVQSELAVVVVPAGGSAEVSNVQGNLVGRLESEKAAHPDIDEAEKKLLPQKAEYKVVTGSDCKPGVVPAPTAVEPVQVEESAEAINAATSAQGGLVRKLKSEKAAPVIYEALKNVIPLKGDFKAVTGSDWKSGVAHAHTTGEPLLAEESAEVTRAATTSQCVQVRKQKMERAVHSELGQVVKKLPKVASVPADVPAGGFDETMNAITMTQGDLVRKLESEKAAQPENDEAVKKLLTAPAAVDPVSGEESAVAIDAAIYFQGALVGKLKSEKASQPQIDENVNKLCLPYKHSAAAVKAVPSGESVESIKAATTGQVDLVRKLESEKAQLPEIDEAVKKLLHLKAENIAATGSVWKPGEAHALSAVSAVPSGAITVASSAQGLLEEKQKSEKAHPDLDEAVTKLLTKKAGCKADTGSALKPEVVSPPADIEPTFARGSSEAFNSAATAQGDIVKRLKSEKAAQPEVDESVKNMLNLTAGDWKTAVTPGTSDAETVHAVRSSEAIGAANNTQGDMQWKLNSEMSELDDCRYSSSQGNFPDGYLPQHLLPAQITAPELYMQHVFSHQEAVSSFQLPVSLILYHPYYGYSFTPVFLENTFIFMENQVSQQQSSEAFQIHDHPQD